MSVIIATTKTGTLRTKTNKDGTYKAKETGKRATILGTPDDLFYFLKRDEELLMDLEDEEDTNFLVFLAGLTEKDGFLVNRYTHSVPPGGRFREHLWDECPMFFPDTASLFQMVFASGDTKKQLITQGRVSY